MRTARTSEKEEVTKSNSNVSNVNYTAKLR
jgi:hypothetical protein